MRHHGHARSVLVDLISAVHFGTCSIERAVHSKWSPSLVRNDAVPKLPYSLRMPSYSIGSFFIVFAWSLKIPTVHLQPANVSYITAHYGVHRERTRFVLCDVFLVHMRPFQSLILARGQRVLQNWFHPACLLM